MPALCVQGRPLFFLTPVGLLLLLLLLVCMQSDYAAANYDVKKARGYWRLGCLGPEETNELQAKVRCHTSRGRRPGGGRFAMHGDRPAGSLRC